MAKCEILDQAKSEGSNIFVAKNFANSLKKVLEEALIDRNINPKAFETCAAFNDFVTGRVKNIDKTIQGIEALLYRKEKSRTKVLRSLFDKFHPEDHNGISIKCIFNHLFKNKRGQHAKMLSLINSHTVEGMKYSYLPPAVLPLYKPKTYKKCFRDILNFKGIGVEQNIYASHRLHYVDGGKGNQSREKKVTFKQFRNWALSNWRPCLRM